MATNREKYIDNASNEELAKWLVYRHICNPLTNSIVYYDAIKEDSLEVNNMKYWLSQEAEEDKERISCNVCKYAISNGYHSSFMHHHICMNPKSAKFNKGVDVVDDGCDKGEVKEAKENKTMIMNDYDNFDEVKITVKAWNEVIDKVRELNTRLDKLEKCNRIAEVKEYIEERIKEKTKDIFNNKNMRPMTKEDAEELVNKIGRCAEEVRQMNKTADEMFEELGYKKVSSDALCEYIKELRGCKTTFFRGSAYNSKKIIINDNLEYWSNIVIDEAEDKAIHKKIGELRK